MQRREPACTWALRISGRCTDLWYGYRHQYAYWWRYPVPGVHGRARL